MVVVTGQVWLRTELDTVDEDWEMVLDLGIGRRTDLDMADSVHCTDRSSACTSEVAGSHIHHEASEGQQGSQQESYDPVVCCIVRLEGGFQMGIVIPCQVCQSSRAGGMLVLVSPWHCTAEDILHDHVQLER